MLVSNFPPSLLTSTDDTFQDLDAIGTRARFSNPTLQDSNYLSPTCVFSGSDLDRLLNHSLAEGSAKSAVDYCIWLAITLEDVEMSRLSPTLSLSFDLELQSPSRHQVLPFWYKCRWQMAIFDTSERILNCYNPMPKNGNPAPLFTVSTKLLRFKDIKIDRCKALQRWYTEAVALETGESFRCYCGHVKNLWRR